jgi:preprotein translocase subunit SecY
VLSVYAQALRTPDLRRKILFAVAMLLIYRLGSYVPTPGVSYPAIQTCVKAVSNDSLYSLISLFSGGALLRLSIFALGIMPYITASIILQLLTVVIPRLEALKKEGQAGQTKITQYTRYLTLGLALLQCTGIIALARTQGQLFRGCNEQLIPNQSMWVLLTMVAVMTAGTGIVMWLGELITDRGIGNGMSLLIFTSIVASFPGQLSQIVATRGTWVLAVVLGVGLVLIMLIVLMEQGQRRVQVQYAKRMVGRREYGGTSTYIPIKVNQAGVIPVIFASSLMYLPVLFVTLTHSTGSVAQWVDTHLVRGQSITYAAMYFLLTVFFTFFYVAITFDSKDVADNMKQYGGFIPGYRAGKQTERYLDYVLSRLTTVGSVYLAGIAVLPLLAFASFSQGQNFIFGGTSIIIMVGVGLDTAKQIESQLQQRNYEGFLR